MLDEPPGQRGVPGIERQDGGCRLFLSRPAAGTGGWSSPEAVIPRPVDLEAKETDVEKTGRKILV